MHRLTRRQFFVALGASAVAAGVSLPAGINAAQVDLGGEGSISLCITRGGEVLEAIVFDGPVTYKEYSAAGEYLLDKWGKRVVPYRPFACEGRYGAAS